MRHQALLAFMFLALFLFALPTLRKALDHADEVGLKTIQDSIRKIRGEMPENP